MSGTLLGNLLALSQCKISLQLHDADHLYNRHCQIYEETWALRVFFPDIQLEKKPGLGSSRAYDSWGPNSNSRWEVLGLQSALWHERETERQPRPFPAFRTAHAREEPAPSIVTRQAGSARVQRAHVIHHMTADLQKGGMGLQGW